LPLKVNEIFYSIQGESTYSGLPCVFIRLTGCNLRCIYCDTDYAYEAGQEMEIATIISTIESYNCLLVEITGGEPLLQNETPLLVNILLKNGYKVLLETNGTQDINMVDKNCIRIMDVKCPSSGFEKQHDWDNFARLNKGDEIKFVISDIDDYKYAKKIIQRFNLENNRTPIHFSPIIKNLKMEILARWILYDHLQIRLHPQLHKIIWGEYKRGA